MSSISRVSTFDLFYLGMIQNVNLGNAMSSKDPDVQLIDRVEEAQLEGKIPLFAKDEDLVEMSISKHGVKVTDHFRHEIQQRHPLHTVAQIVYYADSFGKSNLSLKIGNVGRRVFDCYVFQCKNEDQAQMVCQSIRDMFDAASSQTT